MTLTTPQSPSTKKSPTAVDGHVPYFHVSPIPLPVRDAEPPDALEQMYAYFEA